ncbi:glycosyltransferase [Cupriavidus oxalaticus]|uniref:glycosyltransferase n=1 Tax=Cupriavidus oxalaticus TaxID=96344 RepID=UPI001E5654A0|nr:glycosyltransferase [Cupriavidus oxalaticus]
MIDCLITVSIVSHGQASILTPLLAQLDEVSAVIPMNVIVTENLPGTRGAIKLDDVDDYGFEFIENTKPKGFGANHNAAFCQCRTPYFFVLNPDLILDGDPFTPVLAFLSGERTGIVAPSIASPSGTIEDSARRVPTTGRLLDRMICRMRGDAQKSDYPIGVDVDVDWVAGMFMGFKSEVFRQLHGFDERFHMYCEDVDVCLRTWCLGFRVVRLGRIVVRHDARRDSHRRFGYLAWHVRSLARMFLSATYWRFRLRRMPHAATTR